MTRKKSLVSLTEETYDLITQLADEHLLTRSATICVAIHLLAAMQPRFAGWKPVGSALIAALNDYLAYEYNERLTEERNPKRLLHAIERTVTEHTLSKIAETDQCRIYSTESGILVNCWWTGARGYRIGPGAAGFDDNIQWFLVAANLAGAAGKAMQINVPTAKAPPM
jgi:hypothetical protein